MACCQRRGRSSRWRSSLGKCSNVGDEMMTVSVMAAQEEPLAPLLVRQPPDESAAGPLHWR
jgi:hypothetical protein